MACMCVMLWSFPSRKEQEIQEKIAGEIVRFRVLANSDSEEDQEIKQKVKNDVKGELDRILKNTKSTEEAKERIAGQMDSIRKTAQKAAGTEDRKSVV